MKPRIANKWTERLRNGNIEQLKGFLGNTDGARCCLGVLCDIAAEEGIIAPGTRSIHTINNRQNLVYSADEEMHALPRAVKVWAGMKTTNGHYGYNMHNKSETLSRLNDSGAPFSEIADIIEQNVNVL